MTPAQFMDKRTAGEEMTLLDVREAWELRAASVPTPVVHIPMGQIPDRLSELDPARRIVVMCHGGVRSQQVARFLDAQGFKSVANLTGGIAAWAEDLDHEVPQY